MMWARLLSSAQGRPLVTPRSLQSRELLDGATGEHLSKLGEEETFVGTALVSRRWMGEE